MMKLMTPVLFAKKLPTLWDRDMKGGYMAVDVTDAAERCLRVQLHEVEGYDHISVLTVGWLRFGMRSLGEAEVQVEQQGWSLGTPGPRSVEYEMRWS